MVYGKQLAGAWMFLILCLSAACAVASEQAATASANAPATIRLQPSAQFIAIDRAPTLEELDDRVDSVLRGSDTLAAGLSTPTREFFTPPDGFASAGLAVMQFDWANTVNVMEATLVFATPLTFGAPELEVIAFRWSERDGGREFHDAIVVGRKNVVTGDLIRLDVTTAVQTGRTAFVVANRTPDSDAILVERRFPQSPSPHLTVRVSADY